MRRGGGHSEFPPSFSVQREGREGPGDPKSCPADSKGPGESPGRIGWQPEVRTLWNLMVSRPEETNFTVRLKIQGPKRGRRMRAKAGPRNGSRHVKFGN